MLFNFVFHIINISIFTYMSQFIQDTIKHCKKLSEITKNLENKIIIEQLKNDINIQINNLQNSIPPAGVPSTQTRNNNSDIHWSNSLRN
tara:strand:- start:436 stop:702 length:267 start_codon:yes stop_codon:yes gene_type:complete